MFNEFDDDDDELVIVPPPPPFIARASLATTPQRRLLDRTIRNLCATMPTTKTPLPSLQMLAAFKLTAHPQYRGQFSQLIPQLIVDTFIDDQQHIHRILRVWMPQLRFVDVFYAVLTMIRDGTAPAPNRAILLLGVLLKYNDYELDNDQLFHCKSVLHDRWLDKTDPLVRKTAKHCIDELDSSSGFYAVGLRILQFDQPAEEMHNFNLVQLRESGELTVEEMYERFEQNMIDQGSLTMQVKEMLNWRNHLGEMCDDRYYAPDSQ